MPAEIPWRASCSSSCPRWLVEVGWRERRLDVAQAGGERDLREVPDERLGTGSGAQVDRHDRAEAAVEEAGCKLEVGV